MPVYSFTVLADLPPNVDINAAETLVAQCIATTLVESHMPGNVMVTLDKIHGNTEVTAFSIYAAPPIVLNSKGTSTALQRKVSGNARAK
jgi:hypothetical protein